MERLTERDTSGNAMAICCGENCKHNYYCIDNDFAECTDLEEIIQRLAVIEDILGDHYNLDELKLLFKTK